MGAARVTTDGRGITRDPCGLITSAQPSEYLEAQGARFRRNFHSKSDLVQVLSGWQNVRYDRLVEAAKRTLDPARRKELYTAAWNIVNVELPHFHLHEVTQTSAAAKALQGYQPNVVGALTYRGGGLCTAYIEA